MATNPPRNDAYTTINKYLSDNWSHSDIVFENDKQSIEAPWIRPLMIPVNNDQVELGENGNNRFDCILNVDIFTDINTGTGEGSDLSDKLEIVFPRGLVIPMLVSGNNIHFGVSNPLPGRPDGYGFYQTTLELPWYTYYN
jgi:hypothetical protein